MRRGPSCGDRGATTDASLFSLFECLFLRDRLQIKQLIVSLLEKTVYKSHNLLVLGAEGACTGTLLEVAVNNRQERDLGHREEAQID